MLKLSPHRALVSWFLTSVDVVGGFFGIQFDRSKVAPGTNLCLFVQVSVLGLVVLLLHLTVIAAGVWLIVIRPFEQYGWLTLYVVGITAGLIAGIMWVSRRISEWEKRRQRRKRDREYDHWIAQETEPLVIAQPLPAGPTISNLLWQYLVAIKQRVCPTIKWAGPIPHNQSRLAKITIHWVELFAAAVIAGVMGGIVHLLPWTIVNVKANWSVASETQCTFAQARTSGNGVIMDLSCNSSTNVWTKQRIVAALLLNKPGTVLTCMIYEDGEAWCNVP